MLEWRERGELIEVTLMLCNQVPIGNVKHCREKSSRQIAALIDISEKGRRNDNSKKHGRQCRQKPSAATIPK